MTKSLTAAFAALAIVAGGSLAVSQPASAESSVTVQTGPGGIAFGYSDGYWDQGHQWHAWQNAQESSRYRDEHKDHYYAYKHDRDADKGWRTTDTWWQH
jgi:hypothetical protein